ncbi:GNAT family N-acetyltransferase [Xylanimonas ulmi]|uniref:Acetyltransferase (GNAT) family protein n=1 Tax=Xylanimonas ulmi TaxID=228973 RepID=A0A4V2EYF4_9MICO|nr:GNAT family N-acetyltransferase [Xylanibacterium ulmi]RZS62800.1 acetyltransferase (GNAT) family protein [Xylanibacterium ulmi]
MSATHPTLSHLGPTGSHAPKWQVVEPAWRIVEVSPDEPADGWAHRGVERVGRACAMERDGHDDDALFAAESAADLAHQDDEERTLLIAVGAGAPEPQAVLGWARVDRTRTANLHAAWTLVHTHPDHRRRGIGAHLLAHAQRVAHEAGRGTLQAEVSFAEDSDGPQAPAPTGAGAAPLAAPGVRFALAHGFDLVQVDRRSTLALPLAPDARAAVEALAADAASHAAGYRLHTWHGEIPERWLDGFALLETRMSTDAPMGGLDLREDVWDAGRVLRMQRDRAAMGHDFVITAAEHVATGELAAMTMLDWSRSRADFAMQWDTIVLRPHRGHRLGMLVKCANLRRLAELCPAVRRVHTWNAEENGPMLAINVALGFRPAGGAAVLQKVAAPEEAPAPV